MVEDRGIIAQLQNCFQNSIQPNFPKNSGPEGLGNLKGFLSADGWKMVAGDIMRNGAVHPPRPLPPKGAAPAKYRHVAAVHSAQRASCLSHDSEASPSFLGFRNLMVIVLSELLLELW